MLPNIITCRLAFAAALLLGSSAVVMADPPGRVGRLSYVEGTASFHTGDQDQWSPAVLNYPVTSGNAFWTEPDARIEIQIGGTEVRLDHSTELDIVRLDDEGTQLHVGQGVVNLHLRLLPPGGIHVVTPYSQADLLRPGSYRIDAGQPTGDTPTGQVQVVVLEGEARIDEPRATLDIQPGESAIIGGNPVSFTLVEASPTPFDDWALLRERRETVSVTARYVSVETTGYEDLDRHGEWRPAPSGGAVWYPAGVPADWAPYRYGHWAFVRPWGWTWVDDAPWGFAPFHYGRWARDDRGWGWHPGEENVRPVYAPALVAFVGGSGWGVSLSLGTALAVGWVPLAPSEVFHPYYQASPTYVRNVNVTNVNKTVINNITVTNVTNTTTVNNFANQQAATVVPAAAFTRAAPIQRATLALPKDQLAAAPVTATVAHLEPTAAAKAGVAQPTTGKAVVPGPNTPATVAKGPVTAQTAPNAAPAASSEPPAPKAPGPTIKPSTASPAAPPAPTAKAGPAGQPPTPAPTTGAPASPPKVASPSPASSPPAAQNSPPAQPQARSAPAPTPGPPITGGNAAPPAARPASPPAATANTPLAPQPKPAPTESAAKPAPGAAPGPPIARSNAAPPAATPSAPPVATATPSPQEQRKPAVTASPVPAKPLAPADAHPTTPAAASSAPRVVTAAPPAAIPHPVQNTEVKPTPSGWVRAPVAPVRVAPPQPPHVAPPSPPAPIVAPAPAHTAPAPASAPAPAAAPAKPPEKKPDDKKPEDKKPSGG